MNEIIKKQLKTDNLDLINEIIEDLKEHVVKGILTYNTEEWFSLNKKYNKDQIKDAMIIAIVEYKFKFPFEEIELSDVNKCFFSLCKENIDRFIFKPEPHFIKINDDIKTLYVIEKYDDFKYSYDNCGLCIIKAHHTHNDISNYFHQKARHKCGTWNRTSSYVSWTTGESLRSNLGELWRMGTDHIDRKQLKGSLRLSSYIATQFKPLVAKCLYQGYKAQKIIDFSCGWGDRLAGFYTSNTSLEYYGFDPNPETFEIYKNQCLHYEKLLGNSVPKIYMEKDQFIVKGKKFVWIQNKAAEDVDYSQIPNDIDFVFTSPPYFQTEHYGKGGENEDAQSWKRYNEYELWRENFLFNVVDKCWNRMEKGLLCLNIIDVINKERYRICDDLVDYMKKKEDCEFKGQIGMKMNLRPNIRNLGCDPKLLNKVPFIEPIWIFSKNGDNRNILNHIKYNEIENLFE